MDEDKHSASDDFGDGDGVGVGVLPQLNTSYKTQAGSDNLPGMQTGVRGQV
jgi:hypothetical protein